MTCRNIMTTNPKCCVPNDSIGRAAEIMRDEDVGPVPVVSDRSDKKVVGIVTDRDIAIKVVAAGLDPQSTRVGDVMSTDLVTCRVDADYIEALNRMARHQVRRIPVVDENGSLAGIISQADVARLSSEEEVGELVEEISEPAGLSHALASLRPRFSRHGDEGGGFAPNALLMGAACLTVGAGMTYLLDPARGRTRRAKLRDKAASLYNDSTYYAGKIQRDVKNRTTGAVASAKSKLTREEEDIPDQKLEARVRSSLGRATSHPHAIHVRAENGSVTLEGNILAREVSHVLSCARSVPGVREVDNRLHVHEKAVNIPELQSARERRGARSELMPSNWSPATRLMASALGGGLVFYGLRSRGPLAKATATAGVGLLTRGISNKEVSSWPDLIGGRRALTH